jgi:hypothetical protein
MNYRICPILFLFVMTSLFRVKAQSFEVQQLVLDIQKLAQEKQLLTDLYRGYEILDKGYGAIRDISKGSFDLHKAFLDGLLTVSPAVKQYRKVTDLINLQVQLVSSYQSAWSRLKKAPYFSPAELDLLANTYSGIFNQALQLLNSLTMILTDGQLRANDGERISQIDELYSGMQKEWTNLQSINNQAGWLAIQRAVAANDNTTIKQLYGLTF